MTNIQFVPTGVAPRARHGAEEEAGDVAPLAGERAAAAAAEGKGQVGAARQGWTPEEGNP